MFLSVSKKAACCLPAGTVLKPLSTELKRLRQESQWGKQKSQWLEISEKSGGRVFKLHATGLASHLQVIRAAEGFLASGAGLSLPTAMHWEVMVWYLQHNQALWRGIPVHARSYTSAALTREAPAASQPARPHAASSTVVPGAEQRPRWTPCSWSQDQKPSHHTSPSSPPCLFWTSKKVLLDWGGWSHQESAPYWCKLCCYNYSFCSKQTKIPFAPPAPPSWIWICFPLALSPPPPFFF